MDKLLVWVVAIYGALITIFIVVIIGLYNLVMWVVESEPDDDQRTEACIIYKHEKQAEKFLKENCPRLVKY